MKPRHLGNQLYFPTTQTLSPAGRFISIVIEPVSHRHSVQYAHGREETIGEIARAYNVSRWTISRLMV
jgi:hypothetical protein